MLGTLLHSTNIPLHALPLRLARRQEISYVAQIRDMAVPLELGARKVARLGTSRRIANLSSSPYDGAVER